ncbi:hypothetical protein OB955_14160 [Halobacteria archaeon AArc-m2/3/4]|uniref:Broad-specificity NMP kinase n=1 Tax=Natronoglomus mannanivorans TaxID=2979990 RepID=A0ABT2QG58_9EURY|nr:hypothetical protein [Halobacteria archaeon AArc-m2/3/4]
MFDGCPECGGSYEVDAAASAVVCPNCGRRVSINREPLLIVSGASGTGKSTVLRELSGTREDVVFLDSDTLWREGFWDELDWYFRTWLRLCRDVAQSNRPPVLFGGGFGVPANLEPHSELEWFSSVHYLALVCDDDEQKRRLRARSSAEHPNQYDMSEDDITEQVEFNRWFKNEADRDAFTMIDTTERTVETTARRVNEWITTHTDSD